MTAVEASGLSRRFGARIVARDLTFRVAPGESVALVGHNGAGKTTLMKMMLGLLRPSAGRVSIFGSDPAAVPEARLLMGYLPESAAFGGALTGRETLRFYARLKAAPARQIGDLLEAVGLGAAADRRVATYSKGMRQRLGLAQALLGAPRLLLLDEPTSGLDPEARRFLLDRLRALRDAGVTLVISSHALSEIESVAGRILVMTDGRLLADGDLGALRRAADLPMRLRVVLRHGESQPAGLPAAARLRALGGRLLEIEAPEALKLSLLARLAGDDAVADLDLVPPSLDEIYARLLTRDAVTLRAVE